MSDSSIGLKPVIEEPSKPMPPSKASSSSDGVDREALQLAEQVGEPEPHEADVVSASQKARISLAVCSGELGHGGAQLRRYIRTRRFVRIWLQPPHPRTYTYVS